MNYLRLLIGVALIGCSSQCETSVETTLGPEQVQKMISTDIEKKLGKAPSAVACPKEITVGKDKDFSCSFKTAAGLVVTAKVHQTNDEGNISIIYAPAIGSPTDIATELQKTLTAGLGSVVTLDCGTTWQIQGVPFTCDVTTPERNGSVTVDWTGETFKYELDLDAPGEPVEESLRDDGDELLGDDAEEVLEEDE